MVSGSGVWAKVAVVDARHHMLGRLASTVAKELLNGQKVVVVSREEICMSGGLLRQKMKHLRFLRKRMNTKPEVQSSQESNLSKFKSEVRSSQEHHFSKTQKLRGEIEKMRSEPTSAFENLRGAIEKLRSDRRSGFENLRGEIEKTRSELRYAIRNSGAAFRDQLEAAKYDVIKYCTSGLVSVCAVFATALYSASMESQDPLD